MSTTAFLTILVALWMTATPDRALSQARSGAFESVHLGLSYAAQVNRNGLNDGWQTPSGGEVTVEAPFYVGAVEAGIQMLPYRSRSAELPDFTSQFMFLAWSEDLRLSARFQLEGGFRLGLFRMSFDHDETSPAQQVEREVRADAVAGLHVTTGAWRIETAVSYGTLFLVEPQRQAFLSIGLSRRLGMPEWLLRVLA